MLEGTNALNISVDDIEAFHRDGAVLIKNVLSKDWLDLLERGIEYIQHHPDGMSAGVGMPLRIYQFPASHSADLDQVMKASPISEIVGRVLERPVRFYMDQMFYKPAGEMFPSAWHQDTSYYNIEGDQVVRAWVCVDPVPRDASIEVVRGSHRWNITYRPPVGMDPKTDPEGAAALEAAYAAGDILIGREAHASWTYFDSFLDPALPQLPDIESSRDSFDILGWDFAPGDVLLFHGNILHSARGGAVLDHPRRAHASLWIGPDVHYLRRRSQAIPDPIQLYDYHPLDGQPLADFDEVFPIAWAPA
ncbi:MAG: phytanoyl-CoA dioxygenase family protein [Pseudomonadales bacterium]